MPTLAFRQNVEAPSNDMHDQKRVCSHQNRLAMGLAALVLVALASLSLSGQEETGHSAGIAVGPQYDTMHVYVSTGDLAAFVSSFTATFGGQASTKSVTSVLPVPSRTEFQYLSTPVGMLSVFAYETPIPFPYGQERTGYLVADMDQAIKAARSAGAEVIVEPFKDPIGMDAVIQWPGGVKMQLYWHFTPPKYALLQSIPDNRVYVSRDRADDFVNGFVRFAHGKVVSDDKQADAGEIGRPGEKYRLIRIASLFGNMQVLVTDGHLPYPFGYETTGYQVQDLGLTLQKGKGTGAKILSAPYAMKDRTTAIVEFPGGYIAEVHGLSKR